MKAQGTDGLSRGSNSGGVMGGKDMLSYIPLHLSPHDREPLVGRFVEDLLDGMEFVTLSPEGWYTTALEGGNCIWMVPPAAGDVVYELVDKARLRHPTSMHVILIPRLLTGMWRRLMTRRTDCYMKIDWPEVWPMSTHFEPLLIFITLPFNLTRSHGRRRDKLLAQFRGVLSQGRLREVSFPQKRDLLRQFLQLARQVRPM